MHLTALDLQSPEKIETLRARGRNFFRCLIDPESTEVLENIIRRRQQAGDAAGSAALQESLEVCRKIQAEINSFPEELQEKLLPLLDLISEEVYLSVCTYQSYEEYQQAMPGR
ncbi:MAG: hypothetical protein IJP07_05485 [Firmicutes bacterium]|nr:hypothetical protein [Bacillota bacterium]